MPSEMHQTIVELLRQAPLFVSDGGEFDVAAARQSMDAMTATAPLPDGTQVEPVDAAGVKAEWLTGLGTDASRVLLYLHGGGHVIGSIASHRALAARIAAAADIRALIIDYRLGPEHPFPAAVEDACAAYGFLLDHGIAPARIAIGGDSAGGGLTYGGIVAREQQVDDPPDAGSAGILELCRAMD